MAEAGIRDRCRVTVSESEDSFVGIRCGKDGVSVQFPLGFRISAEDRELRRDIMLLLSAIGAAAGKRESRLPGPAGSYNVTAFPVQAYMAILQDFFARGYYRERETVYGAGKQGKIHWGRTIRNKKAYVQEGRLFYLDFVTKKSTVNEDALITLIHEYCVYESFSGIGWLFTEKLPPRPRMAYNERLFRRVLTDKLARSFNDRNRRLFRDMLAVVEYQGDGEAPQQFRYGTYRFEYVWEALIDRAWGVDHKKDFFPRTEWRIEGESGGSLCLEPDTILLHRKEIYVLDAKYYRYGITKNKGDLPGAASVSKQIIYGEYVAEHVVRQEWFQARYGEGFQVYNAFLMPYQAEEADGSRTFARAGEAVGLWKANDRPYERVQGILVDTKSLMRMAVRQDRNESDSDRLAECIREGIIKEF